MSPPTIPHDGAGTRAPERLRISDFLGRHGIELDIGGDRIAADETLLEGRFLHEELRSGLTLHLSDVQETRHFTVASALREELACIFFLDGSADLTIGDRRFEFHGIDGTRMQGTAIVSAAPESFARTARGRQHVCHLVVSATPEWLDLDGLEATADGRGAALLLKEHLAHRKFMMTPRIVELVRQIVRPVPYTPALRSIYLEARAVEIVAETVAAVTHADRRDDRSTGLSRGDVLRLHRAREVIAANLAGPLRVEAIAREAGISASGLQRLFRNVEGRSVFEYIRRARLDRAFALLRSGEVSVQQASVVAGYANPANFATAFKRQFGINPRAATGMGRRS